MKKSFVFLVLALTFSFCNAKVVDWVVALVENEPITHFEIEDTMKKMRISKQAAINFLVDEKLLNAQIKNLGITVAPFEINQRIDEILSQNKISKESFKAKLAREGTNFEAFKRDVAQDLKKEKLYRSLFARVDSQITPESVKRFYEMNKDKFGSYTTVNLTRYFSQDPKDLQDLTRGKKSPDIISRNLTIRKNEIDRRMFDIFSSIPNGGFTQIVPSAQGYYEIIRINSKGGFVTKSFNDVKNEVFNIYVQEERRKVADEYFAKLRSNAIVKFNKEPK